MALQPYWEMAFATACTMAAAWLPPAANACAIASAAALADPPPSAHQAAQACLASLNDRESPGCLMKTRMHMPLLLLLISLGGHGRHMQQWRVNETCVLPLLISRRMAGIRTAAGGSDG